MGDGTVCEGIGLQERIEISSRGGRGENLFSKGGGGEHHLRLHWVMLDPTEEEFGSQDCCTKCKFLNQIPRTRDPVRT